MEKKNIKEMNIVEVFQDFKSKIDIRDRYYRFRKYPSCFIGSEAVDVMMKNWNVKDRKECVKIGEKFIEYRWVYHVALDHNFKDAYLFYSVTTREPSLKDIQKKDIKGLSTSELFLQFKERVIVKDRTYRFKIYPDCFIGSEAVSVMMSLWDLENRSKAVEIGKGFLAQGFFHHVNFDHNFKDENLFYRFAQNLQDVDGQNIFQIESTDSPITKTLKKKDSRSTLSFKKSSTTYENQKMNSLSNGDFENNYIVNFNSIFTSKKMLQAFGEHLYKEFNLEPLEFLMGTDMLEKELPLKNEVEQIKIFTSIINKFIKEESDKELNLPSQERDDFFDSVKDQLQSPDKWILEVPPKDLFKKIIKGVIQTLYLDSWPRFTRSEECQEIIKEFLNDPNIVSFKGSAFFKFAEKEFDPLLISEKDLQFCKIIAEDGLYWVIGQKPSKKDLKDKIQINYYWSQENFFPNLKIFTKQGFSSAKFEMNLPYPFEKVLMTQGLKNMIEIDPSIIVQDMKSFESDERMYYKMKNAWILPLFEPRVHHYITTSFYDLDTFIVIGKPYTTENPWLSYTKDEIKIKKDAKPTMNNVYNVFDYFFTIISRTSDHSCCIKHVHILSIGGWVKNNASLLKLILHDRAMAYKEKILSMIKSLPKDFSVSDLEKEDDPFIKMYLANMNKNLKIVEI